MDHQSPQFSDRTIIPKKDYAITIYYIIKQQNTGVTLRFVLAYAHAMPSEKSGT